VRVEHEQKEQTKGKLSSRRDLFLSPFSLLPSLNPIISSNLNLFFFFFSLLVSNLRLHASGKSSPTAQKTGTTIAGVLFRDGVVLGADTRATAGSIVADKNCEKIHFIADNIYCCGAGTSADTEAVTAMVSAQLGLHRLATARTPRVVTACTLLKQFLFARQGHVSAYLVLGGVDQTGASLYTVAAHGSTDRLPFVTMGSGSLAAMAVFEDRWQENLELDAAVLLVQQAIMSGVNNDLGSGGNVDITIITKAGAEIRRNSLTPNERPFRRPGGYTYPRGTTAVLRESFTPLPPRVLRGAPVAAAAPAAAAAGDDDDKDDKQGAMKTD